MPRRVVITGAGALSPYGHGVAPLLAGLGANRSAVSHRPELGTIPGLRCQVAARVPAVDLAVIPRKARRYMSAMSGFATLAAEEAIQRAGLTPEQCQDGQTGVCIGSTTGSTLECEDFFRDYLVNPDISRLKSTHFFKIMNHSCAANVALALGTRGHQMAPSAACATGTVAIGLGYEAIANGHQLRMLCGGADEYHPLTSAVFDVMNAASVAYNDRPTCTPRPFDRQRDGVVCGEGAGILLLEDLDEARRRGAPILGEILAYATNTDPGSIANPDALITRDCMARALRQANLAPDQIDLVNAHATGTREGDIAEGQAIGMVFGNRVPVQSLKGHLGHTMAACGPLELIGVLHMIQHNCLFPTLNLDDPDPDCGALNLVRETCQAQLDCVLKTSFALGGVNTAVVVRRLSE